MTSYSSPSVHACPGCGAFFLRPLERSHIYIAQPPLYKVKHGRDERYLKDDVEEASYMMTVALNGASLIPRDGADPITGDRLTPTS